jgi:hypothetical protein
MSNPVNNVENRKKNRQLQHVPLLPNLDNIDTITSYSRIDVDSKLLQKSCIGVLNDKAKLAKSAQSFKNILIEVMIQLINKYMKLYIF